MILVLGILSLALCALFGPFAWLMGNNALKDVDSTPGGYTNQSSIQVGRICGMVATILLGVAILLVLVAVVDVIASGP